MKGTKLFAGLFVVAVTMVVFVSSCSKSTTNPNAAFIGTYYGNISTVGFNYGDTIVITAGSTSSSVILLSKWSNGLSNTMNGTVSGATLTIPSQAITVGTANDTVNGTGALANSVLTIGYSFITSNNGTVPWSYSGTKQ